jgi:rod shape-determining protein MreD
VRLLALFSLATLIALALQTAVLRWLPLGALIPDLVMILAVDLGLRHHEALGAVMAFSMGYATDAFSGSQIGLNAFMVTLIFLLFYEASRRVVVTSAAAGAGAVFVAVLLKDAGCYALSTGFTGMNQVGGIVPATLLQALITAALAPAVFSLLARGKRLVGLPARKARE